MKGKGKGKDSSDSKDCPLQFLDFAPTDHVRVCPRYTSVLQRGEEEGIGLEDLDVLQLELESLLVSLTKRRRQLEQEMQILITWQDKKEKKPVGKVVENPGKRSRPSDGKPCKKSKDASGKAHPSGPLGRPKSKNIQAKLQEYEFTDSPMEAPRLPKNDAPNRFWASVEPYCAEITQEDIKILEELVKSHDDDAEYNKIPALGKHYSLKWAQEDIIEEQKEGSKVTDSKRRGLSNNTSINSTEAEKLFKKVEKEYESDDSSPFGALTQRLVTCLIEENLMTLDDSISDNQKDNTDGGVSPPPSKGGFIKSLNINNTAQLERRIRKELEEQGILDVDEALTGNADDEVLSELRKCHIELRALSAHNLNQAKRLLRLAKEEMTKQEIRKKLQLADGEVMEAYRRIMAARQKKRSPTKKEKDLAWKALKERENILKQLDSVGQVP